jgi:hypothetical protein
MALSNLIWWPWFGKGAEEPVVSEEQPMGGIRPYRDGPRRRRDEVEDDDELIAVVLLSERV